MIQRLCTDYIIRGLSADKIDIPFVKTSYDKAPKINRVSNIVL